VFITNISHYVKTMYVIYTVHYILRYIIIS